jgi:hypothetical protein
MIQKAGITYLFALLNVEVRASVGSADVHDLQLALPEPTAVRYHQI